MDVNHHSHFSLVASRLHFQNKCLADFMSQRSSWVLTFSLASQTSSHHYLGLTMLLPRFDWISWLSKSFKFIVCPWLSLMLKNENIWHMICLPVSIGHLCLSWVSSEKIDLSFEVSRHILHDSFGDFRIKSFQTPFGACRTRTLNGPILPCLRRHPFLLTNRW